jgi:lysophospholipase L1-like esterase
MKAKKSSRKAAKAKREAAHGVDPSPPRAGAGSNAPDRLSRRRRLLFLSIPYLMFVLLLLAIEAGTRLFLPHVSLLEALVQSQKQQSDFVDRSSVSIFEGDPLLFWRLKPNLSHAVWDFTVVSTNAQGLRHDGDLGRKTPGAIRIVCLGDSVTFGYRVPVVWPERPENYAPDWLPYPMLLERSLRAANPGRQIEVIALAVPGYTSYQGLAWLRRDIEYLQPDIVTACFGWNDIGLRAQPDSVAMPVDWVHVTSRRLLSHSQALMHLKQWLQRRALEANSKAPAPAATIPRVPQAEYVQNLLEIARLGQRHDASVVIIAPVYRDAVTNPPEAELIKAYRDRLRDATQQAGISYLEIEELTETNHPATIKLFGELIHPNHEGHRLMATALLKHFAAHNMLKGLTVPPSLSSD